MMTVGENIQEAVDFMEKGLHELAFAAACAAIGATIRKAVGKSEIGRASCRERVYSSV